MCFNFVYLFSVILRSIGYIFCIREWQFALLKKKKWWKNIEESTVKFMFRNICDEICTVLMYIIIFEYVLKMCVILFYAKEPKIEQKSIFSMKYTFDKQKTTETICIYLAWFYSGHWFKSTAVNWQWLYCIYICVWCVCLHHLRVYR